MRYMFALDFRDRCRLPSRSSHQNTSCMGLIVCHCPVLEQNMSDATTQKCSKQSQHHDDEHLKLAELAGLSTINVCCRLKCTGRLHSNSEAGFAGVLRKCSLTRTRDANGLRGWGRPLFQVHNRHH
nr:hypothetical protein CFP56_78675 [Quercus suber]